MTVSKGRHVRRRIFRWKRRPRLRPRTLFKWVDARTRLRHLLTPDAAAAGLKPDGHYKALCGITVLPASMTDAGRKDCQLCLFAVVRDLIPDQRSKGTR